MKRRNRRRMAEEWWELFAEQDRSAESQTSFCSRRGISLSSFQNARRRLRGTGGGSFVEVSQERAWESEVAFPNGVVVRMRGV
jgi:hypothetical protein